MTSIVLFNYRQLLWTKQQQLPGRRTITTIYQSLLSNRPLSTTHNPWAISSNASKSKATGSQQIGPKMGRRRRYYMTLANSKNTKKQEAGLNSY
jgi:hypothetical protein